MRKIIQEPGKRCFDFADENVIGLNRIVETHRSIRAAHDNLFPLSLT